MFHDLAILPRNTDFIVTFYFCQDNRWKQRTSWQLWLKDQCTVCWASFLINYRVQTSIHHMVGSFSFLMFLLGKIERKGFLISVFIRTDLEILPEIQIYDNFAYYFRSPPPQKFPRISMWPLSLNVSKSPSWLELSKLEIAPLDNMTPAVVATRRVCTSHYPQYQVSHYWSGSFKLTRNPPEACIDWETPRD